MRTRPERQRRFFKARIIKYNRKMNRLGEKVLEPDTFSQMMIEGQTLLTFSALDLLINQKP